MNSEDLKKHCIKVLSQVGASEDYTKFFVDVVQCENDIDTNVHRMHQKISSTEQDAPADPDELLRSIQELTKSYHGWKGQIDLLSNKSRDLPALKIDPNRLKQTQGLRALCSIHTKELKLNAGDELKIVDATQPNKLKVRTSRGDEGYVPALSCLLPSPDKNAITAPDRLKLHLLASWRDSMNKSKVRLMACLVGAIQQLTMEWKNKTNISSTGAKERVARRLRRLTDTVNAQLPNWDLTKLHYALFNIEKELETWHLGKGTDLDDLSPSDINEIDKHVQPVINIVASLDKAVLCYQMFRKQWYLYRKSLERCPRPMHIVDQVEQLRTLKSTRNFRYYEVKVTREEVETVEEVVERRPPKSTVQAEELTTKTAEERRRFVITAVIDPRSGEPISFQDAINARIIDPSRGMYMNPNTGAGMSIPEAMNSGRIQVEHSTAEVTKETTKAVGLMTIRTRIERRHYTIRRVTDAGTGNEMSLEEAKRAGVIDSSDTHYTISNTGEKVPLEKAIERGWVEVENEGSAAVEGSAGTAPEFETKTFAVNAVVDQRQKRKVPFADAIAMGLIDRDNGTYINNVTGERVHVSEAIRRGFLKAHEVDDTSGLDIDTENTVVVERMEKIRRNVLKSMGVIKAFKLGKKKPATPTAAEAAAAEAATAEAAAAGGAEMTVANGAEGETRTVSGQVAQERAQTPPRTSPEATVPKAVESPSTQDQPAINGTDPARDTRAKSPSEKTPVETESSQSRTPEADTPIPTTTDVTAHNVTSQADNLAAERKSNDAIDKSAREVEPDLVVEQQSNDAKAASKVEQTSVAKPVENTSLQVEEQQAENHTDNPAIRVQETLEQDSKNPVELQSSLSKEANGTQEVQKPTENLISTTVTVQSPTKSTKKEPPSQTSAPKANGKGADAVQTPSSKGSNPSTQPGPAAAVPKPQTQDSEKKSGKGKKSGGKKGKWWKRSSKSK